MTGRSAAELWCDLVAQWSRGPQGHPGQHDVQSLLSQGLEAYAAGLGDLLGDLTGAGDPTPAQYLRCEIDVVRASGLMDVAAYTEHHPPVRRGTVDAVEHFCTIGWRGLRNPSLGFDVWWYWAEHLDPAAETMNPLLHYALVGRLAGLSTVPPREALRPATSYAADVTPRRVCLFAGHDVDGVIDDYVLDYLSELSRHSDVYYLSDGYIEPEELGRLGPVTRGAWALDHGAYDFGSYSTLAGELVGWDTLEAYDEVLLVNDSAFLLRPLDEVFARMDRRACDWWGLQASKHGFDGDPVTGGPLSAAEAKATMLDQPMLDDNDHFHLSSYFLALRAPVFRDPGFRRRFDAVVPQPDKQLVIYKYEIGLSRYLLSRGFDFDTFIPGLYAFHPLYTAEYFDLLELGFPLLKRNFLSENSKNVPDLVRWKERVSRAVPAARVDAMERNLLRVSPDDRLQRSFALVAGSELVERPVRPLTGWALYDEDRQTLKFDHWWGFPVDDDHYLSGGVRAVFEAVRDDPSIKKVVLTRSRRIDLDGSNVVVVPLHSVEGQRHLLRCGQVFVHDLPGSTSVPVSGRLHQLINVRETLRVTPGDRAEGRSPYRAVVASSPVAALAVAEAFRPLALHDVWVTGNPRTDFVLCPSRDLPPDLRLQEEQLHALLRGRQLVLFEPSYRPDDLDGGYPSYAVDELAALAAWCRARPAVVGFRDAAADRGRGLTRALWSLGGLPLRRTRFPSLEVVDRVAVALVTDRADRAAEFTPTGKPLVLLGETDGGVGSLVPGTPIGDLGQLPEVLDRLLGGQDPELRRRRELLVQHTDGRNARRLALAVRAGYLGAVPEPSPPTLTA